jgi:hypothetical protein
MDSIDCSKVTYSADGKAKGKAKGRAKGRATKQMASKIFCFTIFALPYPGNFTR